MGLPNGALHGLVKRGMYAVNCHMKNKMASSDPPVEQPKPGDAPVWGIALVFMTFLFFVFFYAAMQYCLQCVVATLTMIETPTSAITIVTPADPEDPDAPLEKDGLLQKDTITVHKPKPITAKIRSTIKHIHSIDGFTGRWRGLRIGMIYRFFTGLLAWVMLSVIGEFPGSVELVSLVSSVVFAHMHMAWTHAIISMSNDKPFYKRFCVPCRVSRQLWLPAAVNSAANLAAGHLLGGLYYLLSLDQMGGMSVGGMWWRVGLFLAASLGLVLFIILPADVTLARIEASLLPAEEETVVPFDRSFGGKVEPSVLGGRKAVPFFEAWRSFDWEARRRIIKLHVKIFLVSLTFILFAFHVLMFLTWAIFGRQIHDIFLEIHKRAQSLGLAE